MAREPDFDTDRCVEVLQEVLKERLRQVKQWGRQRHPEGDWALILGEEYGEACQSALQQKPGDHRDLRGELIQVAAVAVAWIEDLDTRERMS